MVRNVKTGELFATFNYDGKDCADMGIYNVTSGAVYTMNIEPTFSDKKLEVPAYDGKYYYGTQITGQQFQFNCLIFFPSNLAFVALLYPARSVASGISNITFFPALSAIIVARSFSVISDFSSAILYASPHLP